MQIIIISIFIGAYKLRTMQNAINNAQNQIDSERATVFAQLSDNQTRDEVNSLLKYLLASE